MHPFGNGALREMQMMAGELGATGLVLVRCPKLLVAPLQSGADNSSSHTLPHLCRAMKSWQMAEDTAITFWNNEKEKDLVISNIHPNKWCLMNPG